MEISWYSIQQHKPEEFSDVFALVESHQVPLHTAIDTNNIDLEGHKLLKHFEDNCLRKIDFVDMHMCNLDFKRYSRTMDCEISNTFKHTIIIKNAVDISNHDFAELCKIIREDYKFIMKINKIMTDFNNEYAEKEPCFTDTLGKEIYHPWYSKKVKVDKDVYICLNERMSYNIIFDIKYLFNIIKPKNLVYMPFRVYNLFSFNTRRIGPDFMIIPKELIFKQFYFIPLSSSDIYDKLDTEMQQMYKELYPKIMANKHCFEKKDTEKVQYKSTETQTALSLRHFRNTQ